MSNYPLVATIEPASRSVFFNHTSGALVELDASIFTIEFKMPKNFGQPDPDEVPFSPENYSVEIHFGQIDPITVDYSTEGHTNVIGANQYILDIDDPDYVHFTWTLPALAALHDGYLWFAVVVFDTNSYRWSTKPKKIRVWPAVPSGDEPDPDDPADFRRNAVLFIPQSLTEEQKEQARANIGAGTGSGGGSAEGAVLYDQLQILSAAQKARARANIGAGTSNVENAVRFDAQNLTAAQKAQARENIGVDLSGVVTSVNGQTGTVVIPLAQPGDTHINVLNPEDVESGYIAAQGQINSSDTYWSTGFIPVSEGDVVRVFYDGVNKNHAYAAEYSTPAQSGFISRTSNGSYASYTVQNDGYLRLSVKTSAVPFENVNTAMVTINDTDPTYIAYGDLGSNDGLMSAADKKKLDSLGEVTPKKIFDKFLFIAYSSFGNRAPNSVPHFEYCAQRDYDWLKADIQPTSDGGLVCCHDSGFSLNGSGQIVSYNSETATPIYSMTTAQVTALVYASYPTTHVATLDDFLEVCKRYGKTPYITIRDAHMDVVVPALMAVLDKFALRSVAVINSSARSSLDAVRAADKDITMSLFVNPFGSSMAAGYNYCLADGNTMLGYFYTQSSHTWSEFISDSTVSSYIANCIQNGIVMWAGIESDSSHVEDLISMGFSGIHTLEDRSLLRAEGPFIFTYDVGQDVLQSGITFNTITALLSAGRDIYCDISCGLSTFRAEFSRSGEFDKGNPQPNRFYSFDYQTYHKYDDYNGGSRVMWFGSFRIYDDNTHDYQEGNANAMHIGDPDYDAGVRVSGVLDSNLGTILTLQGYADNTSYRPVIRNVHDPVDQYDVATKKYVDENSAIPATHIVFLNADGTVDDYASTLQFSTVLANLSDPKKSDELDIFWGNTRFKCKAIETIDVQNGPVKFVGEVEFDGLQRYVVFSLASDSTLTTTSIITFEDVTNKTNDIIANAASTSKYPSTKAVYDQYQRKPAIIWETNGTGLLSLESDLTENSIAWQLTNLDFTPFKRIKVYTKSGKKTSGVGVDASNTPAVVLEMSLDSRAASPTGGHYVGSYLGQKPNDANRLFTVTCAVKSDKTSFAVLRMSTLYGTAATANSDVNGYVFKIEGYYD